MTSEEAGAVVLLRTIGSTGELASAFAAMNGVSRVDAVKGPYDLVIHAMGIDQVEIIERFPGVSTAEVCWLSPVAQGGLR